MHHEISSFQNSFAKKVLSLQKKRERKTEDQFVIEGLGAISLALRSSYQIEMLCYCPFFLQGSAKKLIEECENRKIKILKSSEALFRKMSYQQHPDGIIALAKPYPHTLDSLVISSQSIFLILEHLEKPGNLGAILRSCDATGVSGVIVVDEGVDVYHPNAIYASRGAVFTIPTVSIENQTALKWLKHNQIRIVAVTPEAKISNLDFSNKGPCAFVMGREHEGLSTFWKSQADIQIKIPMMGVIDSLNVSVTAALLLFEALKWQK